jgi:site-specific DNA-cytosine methylase
MKKNKIKYFSQRLNFKMCRKINKNFKKMIKFDLKNENEKDENPTLGVVLSLFDGISCGQIALNKAGISYGKYYASEIDKHAIKVTQHNFPNTIQLGNVNEIKGSDLPKIDLLIGGSPCQSFSNAGLRNGFDGKSGLFWEFVRILKETKPTYFLLENVVMKQEWQDIISEALGVEPIKINSSLLSSQNRVRLYWANFPIEQPDDKGIKLIDILENTEMINPSAIRGRRLSQITISDKNLKDKEIPITQCLEVRATNQDKSNCLTTVAKDNVLTAMPIGRHPNAFKNNLPFRYYTTKEYCRLQTVPENYFDGVASENQIRKMIGNGWNVDTIAHIFKGIK